MWFPALVCLTIAVAGVSCIAVARRRLRQLRTGGVDVAIRTRGGARSRGWHLGVAHYRGEEFIWYRALSLRSGPNWVLNRCSVEIVTRRQPSQGEKYSMPSGSTILVLKDPAKELEIAMAPDALTGFLSWLESAPPGVSVPWAS